MPDARQTLKSVVQQSYDLPEIPLSQNIFNLSPIEQRNVDFYGNPTRPVPNFIQNMFMDQGIGSTGEFETPDIAGPTFNAVTGVRNASKILGKIGSKYPESALEAAKLYIKYKYPKIYNMVRSVSIDPVNIHTNPDAMARFDPITNKVRVPDWGSRNTLEDYASYLAHELRHGIQWNRQQRYAESLPEGTKNIVRNPKTGNLEDVEGQYFNPHNLHNVPEDVREALISNPNPRALEEFIEERIPRYLAQPVEQEAFKTEETAKKTFRKFLDIVQPDDFTFSPNTRFAYNEINRMLDAGVDINNIREIAQYLKAKGYTSMMTNRGKILLQAPEQLFNIPFDQPPLMSKKAAKKVEQYHTERGNPIPPIRRTTPKKKKP